jgi:hypothetical protein
LFYLSEHLHGVDQTHCDARSVLRDAIIDKISTLRVLHHQGAWATLPDIDVKRRLGGSKPTRQRNAFR